ncbi:60S ribosomal protein L7 [Mycena chlorophos]|uniref:60S ribosomal protein L7 n=1 Tax=Mycena chlorophos TaxID=658473 RepID=A0A8H6STF6_MYCCL|nr:60S ribosomal protein L7 [Mycena chlorophos]
MPIHTPQRVALINAVRTSPADPQTAAARLPIPHVNILGRQFSPNRLEDYYYSAVQGNAMYMTYIHEAGPRPPPRHIRLTHDPENPYSKYRANPPVGGNQRGRLPPPADTPENVIRLDKIVVHSFLKQAVASRSNLLGLVMAMPQLTGETVKQAGRHKVGRGGGRVREEVGRRVDPPQHPRRHEGRAQGRADVRLLAQLVELGLPRLKDFPGVMLPPPSGPNRVPAGLGRGDHGSRPTSTGILPANRGQRRLVPKILRHAHPFCHERDGIGSRESGEGTTIGVPTTVYAVVHSGYRYREGSAERSWRKTLGSCFKGISFFEIGFLHSPMHGMFVMSA